MEAKANKLASNAVLSGFLDIKHNPPRLVATLRTYVHPETKKEVALYPVPAIAAPSYIRSVFSPASLLGRFDKILCEDGQLPVPEGTPEAVRQKFWVRAFPFVSVRRVVPPAAGAHYDGLVERDRVETRMAFEMLRDRWDPPVDPRSRRGVERIASYPDGTKVCVPWNVYHMRYFQYRLEREGYELASSEEMDVMGFRVVMYFMVFVSTLVVVAVVKTIGFFMSWAMM